MRARLLWPHGYTGLSLVARRENTADVVASAPSRSPRQQRRRGRRSSRAAGVGRTVAGSDNTEGTRRRTSATSCLLPAQRGPEVRAYKMSEIYARARVQDVRDLGLCSLDESSRPRRPWQTMCTIPIDLVDIVIPHHPCRDCAQLHIPHNPHNPDRECGEAWAV